MQEEGRAGSRTLCQLLKLQLNSSSTGRTPDVTVRKYYSGFLLVHFTTGGARNSLWNTGVETGSSY
eukprot:3937940-Rhodomonas_salina.2